MFHGPRKPLNQMTNREIISSIVAFVLIGGFIITVCILLAVRSGSLLSVIWNAIGVIFVVTILVSCVPRAVAELRRRRGMTQNQEREPSS